MFESDGGTAALVAPAMPFGWGSDVGAVLAGLAEAPGSPGAAALLSVVDPIRLSLSERVDLVRAWERLASWAASAQLVAIAALEAPDPDDERATDPAVRRLEATVVPDLAREELAAALHVSGFAAQTRLTLARELTERLSGTAAALRVGTLSVTHCGVIATGVSGLSDELAATVEAMVLPAADKQTPPELRRAVARAVLQVEPRAAAERAAAAAESRFITSRPLPDGMSELYGQLPAADMQTVLAGLDAEAARIGAGLAAAGTHPDDIPGVAARRTDGLVAWARRALTETDTPTQQGRRPHIQVTVSIGTLLGLDDQPAELAGYGPIDADTARRIAADGTWRRLLTDPATGDLLDYGRTTYRPPADLREFILAKFPTCASPGCARPSRRCHLDHIIEWHDGGKTERANVQPACLRHHICKSKGGWTVTRGDDGAITWTSPAGKSYQPECATGPPIAGIELRLTGRTAHTGPDRTVLPDAPPF